MLNGLFGNWPMTHLYQGWGFGAPEACVFIKEFTHENWSNGRIWEDIFWATKRNEYHIIFTWKLLLSGKDFSWWFTRMFSQFHVPFRICVLHYTGIAFSLQNTKVGSSYWNYLTYSACLDCLLLKWNIHLYLFFSYILHSDKFLQINFPGSLDLIMSRPVFVFMIQHPLSTHH